MNATTIGGEIESENESGWQFQERANVLDFGCHQIHKPHLQIREIYDPLSKELEPPMTQIIGIICKEYILVASESQYTTGKKRTLEAQKINAVKFKNYEGALIAEGGSVKTSNRAVYYIRQMAAEATIDSEIAVSQIAEAAMKKTKEEILSLLPSKKENYTKGELEAIFTDLRYFCGLVIAYWFKGRPCLYTISLNSGLAERQSPYAVLGCDNTFSEFFLKPHKWEEMEWKEAFPMLIEILDKVNDDDKDCGGQIRLAGLSLKLSRSSTIIPAFWMDETINRVVKKLRALRVKRDRQYKSDCRKVMEKIGIENINARMKLFEKKYPESTLAIGEDAGRASAEKWNKEHPEDPVPIDEWIAKSKQQSNDP